MRAVAPLEWPLPHLKMTKMNRAHALIALGVIVAATVYAQTRPYSGPPFIFYVSKQCPACVRVWPRIERAAARGSRHCVVVDVSTAQEKGEFVPRYIPAAYQLGVPVPLERALRSLGV